MSAEEWEALLNRYLDPTPDILTRRPDLADLPTVGIARSLALRSEA